MTIRISIILILIVVFTTGCTGPTMQVKSCDKANLRPMGLFICSSTEPYKDTVYDEFIIPTVTAELEPLLKEKYDIKPLNAKIQHDDVFTKYPYFFSIDEKKIASIAKQEGCKSCLIIYYAAQSPDFHLGLYGDDILFLIDLTLTSMHAILSDKYKMNLYYNISLYGWIIDTEDTNIISKSYMWTSFDKYIRDKFDTKYLLEDYVKYIRGITHDMFLPMVIDDNSQATGAVMQ